MVRIMISYFILPKSLYILNKILSKTTVKILYEFWTGKKSSLKYLHIWGFPAEAGSYGPNKRKLVSKIIGCYFIGYCEKLKGYKF